MNELEPLRSAPPTFLPRQDEYHRVTDLATRLAGTEFVPSALRGKPASVLAAMLVGREVGIGPMHALRSIHVIEGKPTLSAELLMALVLKAGHDLYVAESSRDRCEVRYRRREWPSDRPDGVVVWTVEDATDAGLANKSTWQKYRRAMLRSRAVSEASRQGFPDVVEGMGYTAEELDEPEEAVVVEAIGVTDEEEDDLDRRRSLHARAAAAYRRIREADDEAGSTAWTSATAGLGPNLWTEADVEILETRVSDLERQADEIAGEDDDPDEDDGGTTPEDEPEPDSPAPSEAPILEVDEDDDPEANDVDPPAEPSAEVCRHTVRDTIDTRGGWRCRSCGETFPGAEVGEFVREETSALAHLATILAGPIPEVVATVARENLDAGEVWAAEVALAARDDRDPRVTLRRSLGVEDAPSRPEPAAEGEDTGEAAPAPQEAAAHVPDGMPEAEVEYRRTVLKRYRTLYRETYDVDQGAAARMHALRLETVGASDGAILWVERREVERLLEGANEIHGSVVPF